jgi:hypothetical protein
VADSIAVDTGVDLTLYGWDAQVIKSRERSYSVKASDGRTEDFERVVLDTTALVAILTPVNGLAGLATFTSDVSRSVAAQAWRLSTTAVPSASSWRQLVSTSFPALSADAGAGAASQKKQGEGEGEGERATGGGDTIMTGAP